MALYGFLAVQKTRLIFLVVRMKLVWSLLGGNNGRSEHDLQNIQIVMWLFVDFLFAHQLLGGAGGFYLECKNCSGPRVQ